MTRCLNNEEWKKATILIVKANNSQRELLTEMLDKLIAAENKVMKDSEIVKDEAEC